jgi:hypothetical protein
MMVAFRISVGREAKGAYVLGNGSAFGREIAPAPGSRLVSWRTELCAGDVLVAGTAPDAQAPARPSRIERCGRID